MQGYTKAPAPPFYLAFSQQNCWHFYHITSRVFVSFPSFWVACCQHCLPLERLRAYLACARTKIARGISSRDRGRQLLWRELLSGFEWGRGAWKYWCCSVTTLTIFTSLTNPFTATSSATTVPSHDLHLAENLQPPLSPTTTVPNCLPSATNTATTVPHHPLQH